MSAGFDNIADAQSFSPAVMEGYIRAAIGAQQLLQVPHLQDLNITGPFAVSGVSDTPGRRAVFTCRPQPGCAVRT